MARSNDKSDRKDAPERLDAEERRAVLERLELARRIARETLEADHQALELATRSAPAFP
jgi:hypothetical protein